MGDVGFQLDPQLAKDSIVIGDLALTKVLLMNDAQYPWFILVPRRANVTEIYQLSVGDQQQLLLESSWLAELMAAQFRCEKMNVANLGNIVSQLHVHHIARHQGDAAWPGPVWGQHPAVAYTEPQIESIRAKMAEMFN